MSKTKNYKKYKRNMKQIDVVGSIFRLLKDRNEESEEEARNVLEKFITSEKCPHCGNYLCLSDLPQYNYLCYNCDENF